RFLGKIDHRSTQKFLGKFDQPRGFLEKSINKSIDRHQTQIGQARQPNSVNSGHRGHRPGAGRPLQSSNTGHGHVFVVMATEQTAAGGQADAGPESHWHAGHNEVGAEPQATLCWLRRRPRDLGAADLLAAAGLQGESLADVQGRQGEGVALRPAVRPEVVHWPPVGALAGAQRLDIEGEPLAVAGTDAEQAARLGEDGAAARAEAANSVLEARQDLRVHLILAQSPNFVGHSQILVRDQRRLVIYQLDIAVAASVAAPPETDSVDALAVFASAVAHPRAVAMETSPILVSKSARDTGGYLPRLPSLLGPVAGMQRSSGGILTSYSSGGGGGSNRCRIQVESVALANSLAVNQKERAYFFNKCPAGKHRQTSGWQTSGWLANIANIGWQTSAGKHRLANIRLANIGWQTSGWQTSAGKHRLANIGWQTSAGKHPDGKHRLANIGWQTPAGKRPAGKRSAGKRPDGKRRRPMSTPSPLPSTPGSLSGGGSAPSSRTSFKNWISGCPPVPRSARLANSVLTLLAGATMKADSCRMPSRASMDCRMVDWAALPPDRRSGVKNRPSAADLEDQALMAAQVGPNIPIELVRVKQAAKIVKPGGQAGQAVGQPIEEVGGFVRSAGLGAAEQQRRSARKVQLECARDENEGAKGRGRPGLAEQPQVLGPARPGGVGQGAVRQSQGGVANCGLQAETLGHPKQRPGQLGGQTVWRPGLAPVPQVRSGDAGEAQVQPAAGLQAPGGGHIHQRMVRWHNKVSHSQVKVSGGLHEVAAEKLKAAADAGHLGVGRPADDAQHGSHAGVHSPEQEVPLKTPFKLLFIWAGVQVDSSRRLVHSSVALATDWLRDGIADVLLHDEIGQAVGQLQQLLAAAHQADAFAAVLRQRLGNPDAVLFEAGLRDVMQLLRADRIEHGLLVLADQSLQQLLVVQADDVGQGADELQAGELGRLAPLGDGFGRVAVAPEEAGLAMSARGYKMVFYGSQSSSQSGRCSALGFEAQDTRYYSTPASGPSRGEAHQQQQQQQQQQPTWSSPVAADATASTSSHGKSRHINDATARTMENQQKQQPEQKQPREEVCGDAAPVPPSQFLQRRRAGRAAVAAAFGEDRPPGGAEKARQPLPAGMMSVMGRPVQLARRMSTVEMVVHNEEGETEEVEIDVADVETEAGSQRSGSSISDRISRRRNSELAADIIRLSAAHRRREFVQLLNEHRAIVHQLQTTGVASDSRRSNQRPPSLAGVIQEGSVEEKDKENC
uniref:Reverse transcriptase domain-containing protein n=1 Tax=Macrostomum lignano TaxID=282301 RepID=A0A1I8IKK5_9PLAT